MRRGLRWSRFAIGMLVLLAPVGVGIALWIRAAARSTLREAIEEAHRLAGELRLQPRPAVLTPAEEGDASTIYGELLAPQPEGGRPPPADWMQDYRSHSLWQHRLIYVSYARLTAILPRVLQIARRPVVATDVRVDEPNNKNVPPAPWLAYTLASAALDQGMPPSPGVLAAAGALLVTADWQLLGTGDTWVAPEASEPALIALREHLARELPDAPSLAIVAAILDSLAARPASTRGVATWLAVSRASAARVAPPGRVFGGSGPRQKPKLGMRWIWSEDVAKANAVSASREEEDEVLSAWAGAPDRLSEAVAQAQRRARSLGNPFGSGAAPEVLIARRLWHESLASARAAVAVARYAAARGFLPRSLSDVVPAYAPSMPTDPITGQPLGYEGGSVRGAGSDVVWTVVAPAK